MSQESHTPAHRARVHPDERFSLTAQSFDLDAAGRKLADETAASSGAQRHRQETLYRHGNTSLALFLFEAGAGLREHCAAGTVFIQVLSGRMIVHARGERHDLREGHVLVMAPGVPHDVHAEEQSRMLLTVCLEPAR